MAAEAPQEWPSRTFFELADYQNGQAFRPADTRGTGLPIIKIAELNEGIGPSTGRAACAVDPRKVIRPGDLLFAWSGSVGVYKWAGPEAALNQHIFKVTAADGVDQVFLRYLLSSELPTFQRIVEDQATTMGHVKIADLKRLRVNVPPLSEQSTIGSLLGSLDDKIELNRRMNQTLEQIAQALFKSWFVDFDPVRAKAEGRWKKGDSLLGMPDDMWDLWPSGFEESEIGEIPTGWTIGDLGEIASCTRDLIDPSEIDPEGRYVGLEHITPKSLSLWHWGRVGDTVSGKARFKRGEILFGKLRPYFHKVCTPSFDGVASTDILTIAPKSLDWFGFALGHFSSTTLVDYATAASNGTKMPRTRWEDLARWQMALPPVELARSLSAAYRPLVAKMDEGIEESVVLGETRDALLPKLLSGEVRVPVGKGA